MRQDLLLQSFSQKKRKNRFDASAWASSYPRNLSTSTTRFWFEGCRAVCWTQLVFIVALLVSFQSVHSTAAPTSQPSRQPTSQPTGQPSFHPTLHGTVIRDIDPSTMSKSTGFRIRGATDSTGYAVSSAGDVNHDGVDDVIIGSPYETVGGLSNVGIVYVVFGRNHTFASDFNMATMTTSQSTGFRISGNAASDYTGSAVSAAGDFNGDGVDDILVCQNLASHTGITYVIFGRRVTSAATAFTDIALSSYASSPTTMVRIFGVTAGDYSGAALSGGADINGDGIDDIILGAGFATPAMGRANAGISYVIFGTKTPADINLSSIVTGSAAGFRLLGVAAGDHSGGAVGSADVNGDGVADVVLGAYLADASASQQDSGVCYVFLGSKVTGARSDVELSAVGSPSGYRINGANAGDALGVRLSGAGDVNGDGAEDIVIGAYLANPTVGGNPRTAAGVAYVLFGRKTSALPINLNSGIGTFNAPGFQIIGAAASDWMGFAVSGAGDVNDDGYADVIVGARSATTVNGVPTMGVSYVVFGHAGTFTTVDLLTMQTGGSTGFRVLGTTSTTSVQSGYAVSNAGDVNGDGVPDLLIGPASYIIYGGNFWSSPTSQPSTRPSSQPSRRPSSQPSRQPTAQPTCQPSRRPSSQPSRQPSSQPSSQPAGVPTAQPSSQPSRQPTAQPMSLPTTQPSSQPSQQPSEQPSAKPSRQPSSQPSSHPSRQPSGQPSAQPTARPSHRTKEIQDIVIGSAPLSNGFSLGVQQALSVSNAGDVNNDGIADIIVGNPYDVSSTGIAYVVFGRRKSLASNLDVVNMVTGRYTGFRIVGAAVGDYCGYSVSGAGDFNGDGVDDVIVGALTASPPNLAPMSQGGVSYVVFGRRVTTNATFIADVNLATLATGPTTLLRIYAAAGGDSSGAAVSGAGDVNGDGKADVIVGAMYAFAGTGRQNGGVAYVIFGTASPADVYLSSIITGSTAGFRVLGAMANDFLGAAVSNAGDVNGDGVGDIIVGAYAADYGVTGSDRGAAYVIFGNRTRTFADVDLLTMVAGRYTGFRLVGPIGSAAAGCSVSSAGDVNGDGIGDLIVGASQVSGAGIARINGGVTYVIYGWKYSSAAPPVDIMLSTVTTANAALGYRILGAAASDKSGSSVSTAGDVNADGFADVIVGAPYATTSRGVSTSGVAYVIFGQAGNHPEVDLRTMKTSMFTGYRILGTNSVGTSVSTAGDVNGDGVDDLVVGTSAFVAYGGNFINQPSSQPSMQPSSRPTGQPSSQPSQQPTSQPTARPSRQPSSQPSQQPTRQPSSQPTGQPTFKPSTQMVAVGDVDPSTMAKSVGFRIRGSTDSTGYAVSNAGDVNFDGHDDVIIGSLFETVGGMTNVGIVFVVFGRTTKFTSDFNLTAMVTGQHTGFRIIGSASNDFTGVAVSGAGDINNDGVDDIILGQTSFVTSNAAGVSYIIFGRKVTSATDAFTDIHLAALASSPSTMIRITGASGGDQCGAAVSDAGDVNGDGIDDVIVASLFATPAAGRTAAGISYVIFGSSSPVDVPLSTIATGSSTGFRILGVAASDSCGAALSGAGDVNGDGIADVIVASYLANSPGGTASGVSYIVFGQRVTGARADVDLATMSIGLTTGFRINGAQAGDNCGLSVSGAGDVNGDGVDDMILGAYAASPAGSTGVPRVKAGAAYVIYGRVNSASIVQLSGVTASSVLGFRIAGAKDGDQVGQAVSGAGDINNDGIADVIVGSRKATLVNGITTAGVAYVIFGHAGAFVQVDLLTMKSGKATGFRILGTTGASLQAGCAVSCAGDLNGDGVDDVIVGAASYVVYGGNFINQPSSQPSSQPSRQPSRQPSSQPSGQPTHQPSLHFTEIHNVNLGTLSKTQGFRVKGSGDQTVTAVSVAGDVNGDGIADMIVGSPSDVVSSTPNAGIAYVVFGCNTTFTADVNLVSMVTGRHTGFRILGAPFSNYNGNSVSAAGDVNGDGVDDVITGAYQVSSATGVSYVIYGRKVTSNANVFADIYLSSMATGPATGFRIFGAVSNQRSGFSVSRAGDVNGDGVGDLVIGAPFGIPAAGRSSGGIVYVVFGNKTTADVLLSSIQTGSKAGFRVLGAAQGNVLGTSVSDAGDVNGDGVDDVIIGAFRADPTGTRTQSGASYVIFGRRSTGAFSDVDLLTMPTGPTTGFRILGAAALDLSGYSVSGAGDVNGDGISDVIVGAYQADPVISGVYRNDCGVAYVVFGSNTVGDVDTFLIATGSTLGFRILGAAAGDSLGLSVSGAGDVNGDGFADVIVGAPLASSLSVQQTGASCVIFGGSSLSMDVDLKTMQPSLTTGFCIYGAASGDQSGLAVSSAGDVNNDGVSDVLIAPAAYVVYGQNFINQPSSQPSMQPSSQPTKRPTSQPSRQPSCQPTSQPSRQPSAQPSRQPTSQPSSKPSRQPSGQPSSQPSGRPTGQPSSLPTMQPSRQPSSQPSVQPTLQPSLQYTEIADIDLRYLTKSKGFTINGAASSDKIGFSVSDAGDVNGDGFGDVIVGAPYALSSNGSIYVVFGRNTSSAIDIDVSTMVTGRHTGFRITTSGTGDQSGWAVSTAGDINGDGVADLAVVSQIADPLGRVNAGTVHVILGRKVTSAANAFTDINLSTMVTGPTTGFRILGAVGNDQLSAVRVAGDVNGDGTSDLIIGARLAVPAAGRADAGISYVLYGRASIAGADIDLASFSSGSTGFKIFGATAGDMSGCSVSGAGDVNGDGVDDVIVGAYAATANGAAEAGISYIVFGRRSLIGDVDLSTRVTGRNTGFRILGATAESNSGYSVSGAGDINGDGIADVIVGAYRDTPSGRASAGITYVIFGRHVIFTADIFADISLSTVVTGSSLGFRVLGAAASDLSGISVSSAGDVNDDGMGDVIIGARFASGTGSITHQGISYVIFGQRTPFADIDLLTMKSGTSTGFRIVGAANGDRCGVAVSRAGDVNGDGAADIIVGATIASSGRGAAYVIYGANYINQPSSQPSSQPSQQPSRQPSSQPTDRPTAQPSQQPSSQPSDTPTSVPSALPTCQPTLHPSSQPTMQPSAQPSGHPSAVPSSQPTAQPSTQPMCFPTSRPSGSPSAQPSMQPLSEPSAQPSSSPTSQPSILPSARPTSSPSAQPSVQPSAQPSTRPSVVPSSIPSAAPSALPSGQPSRQPSGQPTEQPMSLPTSQPSASPSTQPSSRPSMQPTRSPSSQPSGQPSSQPSEQPVAVPSSQPSVQPSRQPSSAPSSRPTGKPPTGEWATTVPTVLQLDKVVFIDEKVWACGGSGDATCVLADYTTGDIFTQYNFGWDTITYVIDISDPARVYISGRTTGAASTTSQVANCQIEPVQLICSVKSFLNTNFLGSSYSPLTELIVFVGKSYNYGTATVVDSTGVVKERNYYFTASGMTSIALLCAASPPNFVGAFVAGTGVSGASTNRIIAGWVRLSTGDLSAMYLVPSSGSIVNTADLVMTLLIEPIGPDLFIGGALDQGTSTNAGAWGYILRTNALYRTVQYGVRYVPQQSSGRRLSTGTALLSSVVRGVARVDSTLFVVINFVDSNGTTSLCVVKTDAATGAIIKQATVSSHNASIACTDITTAAMLLDITCTVLRVGSSSQQAQLISVDRELSFTRLPAGFSRGGNDTFVVETVPFNVAGLTATKQSTTIATTDTTVIVSNEVPTMRPTLEPTVFPSVQPSDVPSSRPTSTPTSVPSVSARPTSTPSTSGPTNTYKPSRVPSVRPTVSPTVARTTRPSKSPTPVPTTRPTATPSTSPTALRTSAPSVVPTCKPTTAPTKRPVSAPTAMPSAESTLVINDDTSDDAATADAPQYVIAVSVTGAVLLIGVCAFLFYKRHELRVKYVHGKFGKVAPGPTLPMWLPDDAPDRGDDAPSSAAPSSVSQTMSSRRAGSLAMFDSDSDSDSLGEGSSAHDSADSTSSMPFFSGQGAFIDGPVTRGRLQSEAESVFVSEETLSRRDDSDLSAPSDMSDFDSIGSISDDGSDGPFT